MIYMKDYGLILYQTKNFTLNMYIDADFTGMWDQQHSALHKKCIITYWIHYNLLQLSHSLSQQTAKGVASSITTRELLPLRHLLQKFHQFSLIKTPLQDQFSTTKTPTLAATQFLKITNHASSGYK
jgi:hypothetical protein